METPAKKAKKNYITWSNIERHKLVDARIKNNIWFSGKNVNSSESWRKIYIELKEKLGEGKEPASCKAQWNGLIKKYKSFFKYKSGERTGKEAMSEEANDWDFFEKIHLYAAKKDNYHPILIDSQDGILCMQETNKCNIPEKGLNAENFSSSSPSFNENHSLPSTSSTSKTRNDTQRIEVHMQKRDKKIGKKISSLLAVFGQMVQIQIIMWIIDASSLFMSSDSDSD